VYCYQKSGYLHSNVFMLDIIADATYLLRTHKIRILNIEVTQQPQNT
jgi:hypothetical protein